MEQVGVGQADRQLLENQIQWFADRKDLYLYRVPA
jgi:hypothetical protein